MNRRCALPGRTGPIVSCSLFFFLFFLSFPHLALAAMGDSHKILSKDALLLQEPKMDAPALLRLHPGDVVIELDRLGKWMHVSVQRTFDQGWIRMQWLQPPKKGLPRRKIHPAASSVTKRMPSQTKSGKTAGPARSLGPWQSQPQRLGLVTTLKDLGLDKGVAFEGAATMHAQVVFFPLPYDVGIKRATFRLHYRASTLLNPLSNIRIDVNDIPLKAVAIDPRGAGEVIVTLPPSQLKKGLVKINMRSSLVLSEDRCIDERRGGAFLHILPETSLHIEVHGPPSSLRDYWQLLPHTVTLSLPPGQLEPNVFKAAWAMMDLLYRQGKQVKLLRLPQVGDIVIAKKALLGMNSSKRANGNNVQLLRLGGRETLAVHEPFNVHPIYLLAGKWRPVAAGGRYRVYPLRYPFNGQGIAIKDTTHDRFELPLKNLGLDTSPRGISVQTDWATLISPHLLPIGMRPEWINLDIVAPVAAANEQPFELFVYLNDVLLRAFRLEGSGSKQTISVMLPKEYLKQFNALHIVARHDTKRGECRGVPDQQPIQILPSSSLAVVRDKETPKRFADLYYYLAEGFDVYLPQQYLAYPEHVLGLLARTTVDYPLLMDFSRIRFVAGNERVQPDRPFLAIGGFPNNGFHAPIRFDQGKITVIDKEGNTLLDISEMPRITVAQIAKSGEVYGLWIRPVRGAIPTKIGGMAFSLDDIAFLDHSGVIMTLNSRTPTLARVYYPDIRNWFDLLGKYRFWFLALAWFLLTLGAIYLYRKTRQHRRQGNQTSGNGINKG